MPIPDKMAQIFKSMTSGPQAVGSGASQFFTGMPLIGEGGLGLLQKGKLGIPAPVPKNVGMGYGGVSIWEACCL